MNIEQIKAKLNKLAEKTSGNKFWKPSDKHNIRLLGFSKDEPVVGRGFHYGIGDKTIVCPEYNYGSTCPICDFVVELTSKYDHEGNKKSKERRDEDWELIKNIRVKERHYVPIVDRSDSEPKVQLWGFSSTVLKQILEIACNEKLNKKSGLEGTECITDPDGAFDLEINFKEANNKDGKGNSRTWPETSVAYDIDVSPLADTKDKIEKLLGDVPEPDRVWPEPSLEDVSEAWASYLGQGEDDDSEEEETEYSSNSAETVVTATANVEDVFEEIAG